jgi:hypothetical protein
MKPMSNKAEDFSGMTVNERFFSAGILGLWDDAKRRRDRAAMIDLLNQVEVAAPEWVADTILANPQKYEL